MGIKSIEFKYWESAYNKIIAKDHLTLLFF